MLRHIYLGGMPGVKRTRPAPSVPTICRALADPTRLALLARIGRDEVCVCDLQSWVRRDQPTVSRHLAMLRRGGLVAVRKEGRWCHYSRRPLPPPLMAMVDLAAPPVRRPRRDGCCG
jgi:DNA-binding transcriptional ArsR family regulator